MGVLLYLRLTSRTGIFMAVALSVAIAYFIALGDNNPIYVWLIEKLPYYVRIGFPQRALLITSTLLPLLASLGFLALYRRAAQQEKDLPSFAIIVGAFALTVLISELYSPQDTLVSVRLAVYLLYGVAIFLLAAGSWGKAIPYGHQLVLAGVAVLVLAAPLSIRINHPVMRVQRDTLVLPTQWIEENVVGDFLGPEESYFRYTSGEFMPTELHNRATLARLRPDTQLIYRRFGTASMLTNTKHQGNDFGNAIWGTELSKESGALPLTRMSAIRWVIIDSPLPNPQLKYLGQFEDEGSRTYFYEVPNPLPRAFAPSAVAYTPDSSTLPQEPSELATIYVGGTKFEGLAGQEESSGPGEVEIAEYRNQKVQLAVSMEDPGWVVLSDTFYPGWTASVDGKAVDIYRANHLFRAVQVPAGEHTVVFSYFPSRLKLGLLLMALSVIGAIALAWSFKYILPPSHVAAIPSPRRSSRSRRSSRR